MALLRLQIGVMALCVLVSACEKAKMRTVPRSEPHPAAAQSAPRASAPQSGDEDLQNTPPPPARPTDANVPSAPPPRPPAPVARLGDGDDSELRDSGPEYRQPVSGPVIRHSDNRPLPRRERPRPSYTRTEIVEVDCPPEQRPRPRVEVVERPVVDRRPVAPRPPRPIPVREEVVVVEQEIVGEQLQLGEIDDLHCSWQPTTKPMTYLRYSPAQKIAWVQYGWPQKWSQYTNVKLVSGLPPYGAKGLTLVTKSGVPIASLMATGNGTNWFERGTQYPYESYFGRVPGMPHKNIRGVCWTKNEPAKTDDNR